MPIYLRESHWQLDESKTRISKPRLHANDDLDNLVASHKKLNLCTFSAEAINPSI